MCFVCKDLAIPEAVEGLVFVLSAIRFAFDLIGFGDFFLGVSCLISLLLIGTNSLGNYSPRSNCLLEPKGSRPAPSTN